MIFESEPPPTPLRDIRRLFFWITVSLLIHVAWLYLLQASLPIQTAPPSNNATLYLNPDIVSSQSPSDVGPLLHFTPPAASEQEIRSLFDAAKLPETSTNP